MAKATRVYLSVAELGESFKDSLRAQNRSPSTIKTYLEAIDVLHSFLESNGMPTNTGDVRSEHVETYIADLLEKWSPGTASVRYRALKVFWRWCDEEGEARPNPMVAPVWRPRRPSRPARRPRASAFLRPNALGWPSQGRGLGGTTLTGLRRAHAADLGNVG